MSIGRNDPCPCGSGKKYKKCCFKKDQVESRLSAESPDIEEVIGPDASIYTVWLKWREARARSDFNFLYDTILSGSSLAESVGDREAFVAACSDGTAAIPSGDVARFRHVTLYEGERARLLQTVGDSDSAAQNLRCECLELVRSDRGWRLTGFDIRDVVKADEPRVDLALFD